jgi:uncharacterized protein YggT (Ycf19 family)
LNSKLAMALELGSLVVALDVLLAWVQEDPKRWPRRFTHVVTEPLLRPIRMISRRLPTGNWDISPLLLIVGLTTVKLALQ